MKRIVSAFMSLLLVFSCVAVSFAASFPDIETDWAINEIEYMVSKGVLNGYENGEFRPTRIVTRAEFIKMMCEAFGLTKTTAINYTDVTADDWFYPYIQRAAAQGFLLNYGTALNPNGELSRQEAAALLVRYLALDEDAKAPTTTYPDYSSIKLAYRDYVLQATYEGLFQGRENGNFDPDATLQRREAAAILCRAVGTIFRGSQEGTDLAAKPGNAVVSVAGITVRDARVTDRMIITEGASGGKIVLEDCDIGELVIRGSATIDLDGTNVDKIIVDSASSGYTTYITMSSGLTIGEVVMKTSARMEIASRTTIGTLTVEKDAKNSSATGYGTVQTMYVDASGFEADKVPTTYELASGITAKFNGTSYSGSSTTAANTGFTAVPSSYASASSSFLTATAVSNGTLYYYYTTSATAPSKTTFDSFYEASAVKGSYTVAKTTMDKSTGSTTAVAAYPYVAVMLRNSSGDAYNPLVITNRASTGFSVAPTVSSSNSYHYLAYTPITGGTLYYYYTNNSEAPTVSSFSTTYNANSTSYKGTIDVTGSQSASSVLLSTSRVGSYSYVAVMLEDSGNESYQPMLVPTSAAASVLGNGFSSSPKCSLSSNGISLSFTAANAGTLQYYFTASNVEPSVAQFDTNIALTDPALTGASTVSAGRAASLTVGKNVSASDYPYVVLRLTSGTTRYNPVVISTSGVTLDLTGTGFDTIPTVSVANGYYYLTPDTAYSARVYYYMTNSTSVASADVFLKNYENSVSSYLSSKTGGVLTATGYGSTPLQTTLVANRQTTYKYLALMVSINGQNYKPLVVPLATVDVTQMSADDLFLAGPMYSVFTASHQIDFTAKLNGRIFYCFTNSTEEELDVDSLIANALFGANNDEFSGYKDVTANKADYIVIGAVSGEYLNEYAAIVFQDTSGNIYEPVYLKTDGSAGYSMASTGFITTPTVSTASTGYPTISFGTMEMGTIYYYFTTSTAGVPTTASAFLSVYNSTSLENLRGTISTGIGNDTQTLYTTVNPSSYPYVIVMFKSADGGTGGYYRPTYLRVGSVGSGSSSSYLQTAFSGTPYLNGYYLYYTPIVTGTLYYSYSDSNSVTDWIQSLSTAASLGVSNYSTMSGLYCQIYGGSSKSVTSTGYSQSVMFNVDTSERYLVLWMVTTAGVLTEPVFISTTSSGTSSGLPTTTSSFTLEPMLHEGDVLYMVSKIGTVKYFFTSTTTSYMTPTQFDATYNSLTAGKDSVGIWDTTALQTIDVSPYSYYKYIWIMYTPYGETALMPVRIQLY